MNVIFWISSDSDKIFPIVEESPITIFTTPSGKPALWNNSINASADRGVDFAGFKITVQPAAIAGEILRMIMLDGKFHGVMAPTTPTGCLRACHCFPSGEGMISPMIRWPCAAFQRRFSTFVWISAVA